MAKRIRVFLQTWLRLAFTLGKVGLSWDWRYGHHDAWGLSVGWGGSVKVDLWPCLAWRRFKQRHFGILEGRRRITLRVFGSNYVEVAYVTLGLHGLKLYIEFPSDWHEHPRAWLNWSAGLVSGAFSIPWATVVPDHGQCAGPRYGFYFHAERFYWMWGKAKGMNDDPFWSFRMPWAMEHVRHDFLNPDGSLHHRATKHEYLAPEETKERHPFTYTLKNGHVQNCSAEVRGEEREWRLWWAKWLPWPRIIHRTISIDFSEPVGEKVDTWKGGVTGCGSDWIMGESLESALRRFEKTADP